MNASAEFDSSKQSLEEWLETRKKECAARSKKHAEDHEQFMADMTSLNEVMRADTKIIQELLRKAEMHASRGKDTHGGASV